MPEQKQVYVGHRYVPKVMGEWSPLFTYEGLSIVLNEGNSYTSKKMVPIGIPISNEEYWVVTGNYNAQIEYYRNEVKESLKKVQENTEKISKITNDVYLEDNPTILPETTSTWISRIINANPYTTIKAKTKKTYYIQTPIRITVSDVTFDMNNAILASQGVVTYQFEIENNNNVTIKNIFTSKIETDNGSFLKATNVTDLTVQNIKGSLTGFDNFLDLRGVSRAKIFHNNIKNSNGIKKGIGIKMAYCVNVSFEPTFLEYFNISVLLTNERSNGATGYMNEGVNLDGLFAIKQNVGIECYQCTQLNVDNIVLDFCSDFAIHILNVNGMNGTNYWLGLQDGAVTGLEIVDGKAIFMTNGTIAGDWTKRDTQKAFYSHVDTPMKIDNVYMIDIDGGNLDRSKIEVTGDYYFQSDQKRIIKNEYGHLVNIFDGQTSTDYPFNKNNMSFNVYSFDQNNKNNFVKSEGYVDHLGIAHINKIISVGIGLEITHVVTPDGFNVKLESTYSMTNYKTIINKFIPKPSHNVMEN